MSLKDVIIDRIDLEEYVSNYTELKNGRGCCPIHNGTNDTSFSVKGKRYKCFSCGSSGTIVNFVSEIENIKYDEAIEKLALQLNINPKLSEKWQTEQELIKELELQVNIAKKNLDKCIDYLKNDRGLTDEIIQQFEIGYNNGIIIPIRDYNGRTVAIAKRQLENKPKYINSHNSVIFTKSSTLFNLDHARRRIIQGANKIYICEGYFDAISCDQQGLAAVAYMGDAISKDQVALLSKFIDPTQVEIILGADNDPAGQKSIPKTREMFKKINPKLNVLVVKFPDVIKDFNSALVEGIKIAELPTEHIDIYCLKKQLENCQNIASEYHIVADFIKSVSNPMIRCDIADFLSERWGKDNSEIRQWFNVIESEETDILNEFKTVEQAIEEYRDILSSGTITLGFPSVDESIGGLRKKEIVFFGGYSSAMKTFMACEFALHMAVKQKLNVLFFSLEMSAGQLIERMIANVLGIGTKQLAEGLKNGNLIDIYSLISEKIGKYIRIIDKSFLSIYDVDKRIKIANGLFESPVDVVIIDYLQYMSGTNNYEELSKTARLFKPLVKENNILCICLSQLNRTGSVWERGSMKQLKGAGDIEATGDWVLMGYRPGENPALTLEQKDELKNIVVITLEKGRRGFEGAREIELEFDPYKTRIREKIC